MEKPRFPEEIERRLRGESLREETIGASGARVWIGEELVLKIGAQTEESETERVILPWLEGRLPVPRLLAQVREDGRVYTLMTRLHGRMLCDPVYLRDPARLNTLLAQALEQLRGVEFADCPCDAGLDRALAAARRRVERGLVDPAAAEPGTFGPGGFRGPEALLLWLEGHRPEEERCFTHGDLCLPNILAEGDRVTGFLDCGGMGAADRWRDLALALRSLRKNLNGDYGGPRYEGYDPEGLLAALGLSLDEERFRYYLLLDELF